MTLQILDMAKVKMTQSPLRLMQVFSKSVKFQSHHLDTEMHDKARLVEMSKMVQICSYLFEFHVEQHESTKYTTYEDSLTWLTS